MWIICLFFLTLSLTFKHLNAFKQLGPVWNLINFQDLDLPQVGPVQFLWLRSFLIHFCTVGLSLWIPSKVEFSRISTSTFFFKLLIFLFPYPNDPGANMHSISKSTIYVNLEPFTTFYNLTTYMSQFTHGYLWGCSLQ